MKSFQLKFLLFSSLLVLSHQLIAQVIPFNDDRWTFEGQAMLLENYQGQSSLYLQNGFLYLKDEQFKNGIIEFDIYMTERVSFSGLFFRGEDLGNYEEIYFRGHHSGHPDAYQYTPVYGGVSGWQLYHDLYTGNNNGLIGWKPVGAGIGYNGILNFAFDRWMHVKLVVKDTQAELYLDGEAMPSVFIRELNRGTKPGMIGLKSAGGPVHFANFSYQKVDNPVLQGTGKPLEAMSATTIAQWEVSTAFPEKQIAGLTALSTPFLNQFQWQKLEAERTGLANFSKVLAPVKDGNTVLAKLVIDSDKEQIKRLDFGYSDRVRVYCNGQILYSGNNGFRTRDYRYLGTIGYFDAVHLPLKKGANTIILAVSENFGGWAVQGKLDDISNLTIKP